MLKIPTPEELREFYPVSLSIPDLKREELFNYVCNHILPKMFGYEAAQRIISESIPDSSSDSFIGFQKFVNLLSAYQEIKDPLVSTNFGAKIIDRTGAVNPTNQQKSITLIDMEGTISAHYRTALEIVGSTNCRNVPSWGGYFSYKVHKL